MKNKTTKKKERIVIVAFETSQCLKEKKPHTLLIGNNQCCGIINKRVHTHIAMHMPYCSCHHPSENNTANLTLKLLKYRQNSISKKVTALRCFSTQGSLEIQVIQVVSQNWQECNTYYRERKISIKSAIHKSISSTLEELSGDGGGLNCFQFRLVLFCLHLREEKQDDMGSNCRTICIMFKC